MSHSTQFVHDIFLAPSDDLLARHWLIQEETPVNFQCHESVQANLQVLQDILSMKPRKEFVAPIMELGAHFVYGSTDFGLETLAQLFCLGDFNIHAGSQLSMDELKAKWLQNVLGCHEYFHPSARVVEKINEIFHMKQ